MSASKRASSVKEVKEAAAVLSATHKEHRYQQGWEQAQLYLKQFPDNPEIIGFMILFAKNLGRYNLALALGLHYLQQFPQNFFITYQLGMLYYMLEQFDSAIYLIEQVLRQDPNNHLMGGNLAIINFEYGRFNQSLEAYQHQIDIHSPDPAMPFGKGLVYLAQGDYQHGWEGYEQRFHLKNPDCRPVKIPSPIWDGKADLRGKILVVTWEQGYGDNIQFIRFLPLLQARTGATIAFVCLEPLYRLFKGLPGINILLRPGMTITHDYQLGLHSIPYLLGLYTETKLCTPPYIRVDPILQTYWRTKITDDGTLKVGICWAGGKDYMHDIKRTLSLKYFIPLLANPKICLYSLQKPVTPEDAHLLIAGNIVNLGADFTDFADTAAAIASLDIVISVDTATAHLAAAMGKPTWTLLRYETEWRHPRDRQISPWYPSMRLFRQLKPGEWDGIFETVIATLNEYAQKSTNLLAQIKQINISDNVYQVPAISDDLATKTKVTEEDMVVLNRLFFENKHEACIAHAKALFEIEPHCFGALVCMARSALALEQKNLALGILLRRLRDEPENTLTHYLLAQLYEQLRLLDKARVHAEKAVVGSPDNSIFCELLAKLYYALGDLNKAIEGYSMVNRFKETPETFINISLALLAAGNYQQGWALYEHRLLVEGLKKDYVQSSQPFWDGTSDISGKKLLLIWEQGLGDVIQFSRFIPLLKQRSRAEICFVCGPKLIRLLSGINGIDHIHMVTPLPQHDYKIYLWSLPHIFGLFDETSYKTKPYLKADKKLITLWQEKLKPLKGYKIGISWKGAKKYNYNKERNTELRQFIDLLRHPHIDLVSLQKELTAEEDRILANSDILNLGESFDDFADTAAVVAGLDLVITVDTAIAHLVGAMGKPVWTLIRYETEWRHQRGRDTSPWYDSMRLWRQPTPGDWASVFAEIQNELAKLTE